MVESAYVPHTLNDVEKRAVERYHSTETVPVTEYYPDDTTIDIKEELELLSEQPKTLEIVQRISNLKRIRVCRKWFNQWFLNTAITDRKQYVYHCNPKFYWPWLPETVFSDTIFINYYPGKTEPVIRRFNNMLFLIDHADANYVSVDGKITLNKLNKLLVNIDELAEEIIRGEKMV